MSQNIHNMVAKISDLKSYKPLPSELVTLIHHIELSNAGWKQRLHNQLIKSLCFSGNGQICVENVRPDARDRYGVNLTEDDVFDALSRMQNSGELVVINENPKIIKLTEQVRSEIAQETNESMANERAASEKFISLWKKDISTVPAEEVWTYFTEICIIPMIRELGARVFDLLSNQRTSLIGARSIENFLSLFSEKDREYVFDTIVRFLGIEDGVVRTYILRQLHAFLLTQVGGLSDRTISKISSKLDREVTFHVFADTNFLFSILSLHENPSNQTAIDLFSLFEKLKSKKVNLRFVVLPKTIEEAKAVLQAERDYLSSFDTIHGSLESAIYNNIRGLSGIGKRFLEARKKSYVSSRDYFRPYIEDLVSLLRAKNVELYNVKLSPTTASQTVIDDIADQAAREEKNEDKGKKPKQYAAIEHDVLIWHFVNEKRRAVVESPLDAEFWIITIDFRFISFDIYKGKTLGLNVPICIHPSTLIQMLQLWLPRSDELNLALYNSVLSLIPSKFDTEAEKLTIKIIQSLSYFENMENIDEKTLSSILMNEALRGKLATTVSIADQIELVKEAVVNELGDKAKELAIAKNKIEIIEKSLSEERTRNEQLTQKLSELENDNSNNQRQNKELKEHATELGGQFESLKSTLNQLVNSQQQGEKRQAHSLFFLVSSTALIALICLVLILAPLVDKWGLPIHLLGVYLLLSYVAAVAFFYVVKVLGEKIPHVGESDAFKLRLNGLKVFLFNPFSIGIIVVSVGVNLLFEILKRPT